ncbi:MAG TPA: M24 family metallopeptidase [Bacteroidales bacterium]|nr:M24 family metallopeptidase [Bacteroidales bacterium]
MKKILLFLTALMITSLSFSQEYPPILSMEEQAELFNKNLEWKLDNVLPEIMRSEGLDMWLVICFENDTDPVYRTMNTWPGDNARRLSILIFHDSDEGFKKLSATWHGSYASGYMYESIFHDKSNGAQGQFETLADYIKEADPKNIGINYDNRVIDDFTHVNGLSHFHYEKLYDALDKKYRDRLVSAKTVAIRWYETRTPWEMSFYKTMCKITHTLIAEFFSNEVIVPDVTNRNDVRWYIEERINEMGLKTWFFPSIDIIRSPANKEKYGDDDIIRRGDVLHCDVGIDYMGLTTDMQHLAYVCELNEDQPPAGLQEVYKKGLRFQQITMEEMVEGRTGNEILVKSLERGKAEDLQPVQYCHPINYFGHGSGMTIGRTEEQEFLPGSGEHPLYNNTTYALEFNVTGYVPEWGTDVRMGFEDDMVFTDGKARLIDGYPEKMYLIR